MGLSNDNVYHIHDDGKDYENLSHDHGFVRQEVAAPQAAVTPTPEEQTVTISCRGLKRKRVTVTITDDDKA